MKEKAKLVSAGVKWGVFRGLVQFCSLLHLEHVAAAAVCPCGGIGCASSSEADVPAFLDGEMRFSITTVCVCCFFFFSAALPPPPAAEEEASANYFNLPPSGPPAVVNIALPPPPGIAPPPPPGTCFSSLMRVSKLVFQHSGLEVCSSLLSLTAALRHTLH